MAYHCEPCHQDFETKEALDMHTLAKHIPKEEHESIRQKKEQRKQIQKGSIYVGVTIVFLVLVYLAWTYLQVGTYSEGQVHWHAEIEIYLCGERFELPDPVGSDIVHGEPYIGTPSLHEHNDNLIHVEGTIREASDITIGKFMEAIGLTFTSDQLIDYKNGDLCPGGEPGKVQLLVNGQENEEFENKVVTDDDGYVLLFE